MSMALTQRIAAALTEFSGTHRLYEFMVGDGRTRPPVGSLLVEAFVAAEQLQEVGVRDIIVLSTSAWVDLDALLGEPAALEACLPDGSRARCPRTHRARQAAPSAITRRAPSSRTTRYRC